MIVKPSRRRAVPGYTSLRAHGIALLGVKACEARREMISGAEGLNPQRNGMT
jgi:hypothetical protein